MHLSSHTNGKEQEYIENKLVNQLKNAPTTAKRSFSYTTAATEENHVSKHTKHYHTTHVSKQASLSLKRTTTLFQKRTSDNKMNLIPTPIQ